MPLETTKAKDTPNARHVTAFREGVFRYLYGGDGGEAVAAGGDCLTESTDEQQSTKEAAEQPSSKQLPKDQRVAFCHFHPKVMEQLLKEKEQCMLKQHRWRISKALGEEIGLQPQDMCPDTNSNDEPTYFALPNYPLDKAMADLETAEQTHAQRLIESQKSQSKLAKSIIANPHQYAAEIQDLRQENNRLSAEIQQLKSKLKNEHTARCKVEQKNQSLDRKLTKIKNRLEKAVESKKTAVRRGRPPRTEETETIPQPPFNAELLGNYIPIMPGLLPTPGAGAPTNILNERNYPNALTTHDEKWEYRYRQLMEYRANFHNCDVPRHWKTNKPLGKWVGLFIFSSVVI
jgi:hypothetical protein